MAETKNIIEVKDLCKTYISPKGEPIEAIRNVNFTIEDIPDIGEFRVLLGPSGCGKSTILKLIAGLIEPTSGEVLVNGRPVVGPGRDRGMVFQTYTSFDWLNVQENVEYGLKIRGIKEKKRHEISDRLIKAVGLEGFEETYPKNLSGGMKQRVAIARTLANNPEILLMDEPFGALDAQTRWEMQLLLLDIWDKLESTILFVTHDIEEAVFLADRIYILSVRPATIIRNIKIPFSHPRSGDIKSLPEFNALEEEILQVIKEASDASTTPVVSKEI